ncbi:hypothetical protein R1flu_011357 [Riccia fluitans]|uniref:Uncharacterized protein n=1 Tax=Riccia fluitans TaxID=41844 RepID=A0ABD1Z7K2_9MARC
MQSRDSVVEARDERDFQDDKLMKIIASCSLGGSEDEKCQNEHLQTRDSAVDERDCQGKKVKGKNAKAQGKKARPKTPTNKKKELAFSPGQQRVIRLVDEGKV